jgi:hypothetical protein
VARRPHHADDDRGGLPHERGLLIGRIAGCRWHLALPAVLTTFLAFQAGGFFPGTVGLVAAALCVLLVLRVTLGRDPFGGWSPLLTVACAALALLATWQLVSASWSDSGERALLEFDRTLLYLLVLAGTGSFAVRDGDLATAIRWVWLAMLAICVCSVATRVFPGTFEISLSPNAQRLDFPLTYWNALGALAMLGAVLALHLSASSAEGVAARVAGAASLPVFATTLYFTFSRGAVAVAAFGLATYLVLARPRRLLTALVAAVPTAWAVRAAYDAGALARSDYSMTAVARDEGRHVALVVAGCVLAAVVLRIAGLWLDARTDRIRISRRVRRVSVAAAVAVCAAGAALAFTAGDLVDRLDEQRKEFTSSAAVDASEDARDRFGSFGSNGRVEQWRVALDTFETAPWKGEGAGTYRLAWELRRPAPPLQVVDGHSLYLETLAELGIPGLVMLVVALAALLLAGLRLLRGPERHAAAAFVAAGLALLAHAGIDWDWEMPVLFAWFFAAGGVAAAARGDSAKEAGPPRLGRVLAGLALLLVAVTPALVWSSQTALADAQQAFDRRDCTRAIDRALDSADRLGVRAAPHAIVGYCDLRGRQPALAVAAMRRAEARDSGNWEYLYGLAIAQALAGQDPRAAASAAVRLNPLEPLARDLERKLRRARPSRWPSIAGRAQIPGR